MEENKQPTLAVLANEVFGDEEKATTWLKTPHASFQGRTPAEVAAATPEGEERVRQTLSSIDHGVFI